MPRAVSARKSAYSVHPGVRMVQDWIAGLREKTGRSLEQWLALVKKEGPKGEKERRDWLKKEQGFGTNAAWWIAERAEGKGLEDGDPDAYLRAAVEYVEEQYSGAKASLRPIYERLLQLALGLGKDVRVCPCKTMVPLYRQHVFAEIKPSTRTRVDLGLALGKARLKDKRLIETGGAQKGDRITHRIPITAVDQMGAELTRWLQTAHRLDG